jgi:sulfur carrier protein
VLVLVNGETQDLSADATLASVVESLHGRPGGRGVAIALDGEVVPRAAWDETRLSDGARVEIVAAVQGG